MADVSITASSVKPTNANTVIGRGIAGVAVNAGQAVWFDTTVSKLKPAISTSQAESLAVVGIALNTAATDQPLAYASSGDVTLGSVLALGTVYVLGSTSGGISTSGDLDSSSGTRYGTVVGVGTSATNLRVGIIASGALNP